MGAIEYILGRLIHITLITKPLSPILAIVFMLSNFFVRDMPALASIGYGLLSGVIVYIVAHILYVTFTALYLMTPSGKLVNDTFKDAMNNL